jgi:predicted transcriptional regulator
MTTVKFTARFSNEIYSKLDELAKETKRSKVGMLRYLIQKASERIEKKRGENNENE